ncbi:putative tetrahydrofolylpolyglutamate synthase [Papiliotrema laurentii]|uniref:Folylpolyglutamate synthase n=1 Tax=Papiliotrema laurentii TaxID=5418 RepID=A0AAD9CYT9_PAPLA|nr:putative tetrahydrofolylpolyglutamate synthase [Papiliotrema laurentii]
MKPTSTLLRSIMTTRQRTYGEAIRLLNTCQSNAATIEAIRKSGGRLGEVGIPEMIDYLRRIGYKPEDLNALNVVHVTGTKGKGSTSAFTERILRAHLPGKIGLYTSPHLCAVRERIRINGEPLSEELFAKFFFEVWERLEADPKTLTPVTPVFPIYFRLLTLLAFHAFLSLGVSATVLEVGIGGLYDSTNIVPKPVTTGISSLGLDHQAVLGNTIEEIARNKAGIYKSGVPALSVPQDQAGDVLESVARANGASEFTVVPILPPSIELGIRGDHQRINASLAIGLAKSFLATRGQTFTDLLPESFKQPLRETKWPGRCQKAQQGQITWLLDGAHTTESLRSCGEWAWSEARPDVLIFNCSGGRAGETLLGSLLDAGAKTSGAAGREALGKTFDTIIFCTNVTYTSGSFKGDLSSNAIDPNDLAALATQNALCDAWLKLNPDFPADRVHALPSIEHAVDIVKGLGEKQVLVAGSLHLVGGVMEVAGLQDHLGMA